ncbi:hypothetical protein RMS29_028455 (plasmid) [Agrobacterium rosae]|uniref:Uncharacterized protein n=1 Tax=Agrobacterium rosae TaxID=1972867 RepID=A0ABU4W519_9HYPH|nr:hypothetical protein [Agrobacterium rosae]MDX8332869.1 hypothetical protein [Agrobacterium rosae]
MTQPDELKTAARKLANLVEFDMNGTSGKGGNGGLMSDDTLRAAHEVHAILNRPPVIAHRDDIAVDNFAIAMKEKMAAKRAAGLDIWHDRNLCTQKSLSDHLLRHAHKDDPIDVANFAMMLHQRAERIAPTPVTITCNLEVIGRDKLMAAMEAITGKLQLEACTTASAPTAGMQKSPRQDGQPQIMTASEISDQFESADWYWRTMDPDDSGDYADERKHRQKISLTAPTAVSASPVECRASVSGSTVSIEIEGTTDQIDAKISEIEGCYPSPAYGTWFNWPPGLLFTSGEKKGQPNTHLAPSDIGGGRWIARGNRSTSSD